VHCRQISSHFINKSYSNLLHSETICVTVHRKIGKYVTVCGKTCINVASLNFLGMSGRNDIEVRCLPAVEAFESLALH